MASLTLPCGRAVLLDDEDYERFKDFYWRIMPDGYVRRQTRTSRRENGGKRKHSMIALHREVLAAPAGMLVDHINGDVLDCRRANLRLCTASGNARNVHVGWGESPYRGVSRRKPDGKWIAQIKIEGRCRYLGAFTTQEEAARAYDAAALMSWGEFAWPNIPAKRQEEA